MTWTSKEFVEVKHYLNKAKDLPDAEYRVSAEKAWQRMIAKAKNQSFLKELTPKQVEDMHQSLLDKNSALSKVLLETGAKEATEEWVKDIAEDEFRIVDPPFGEE